MEREAKSVITVGAGRGFVTNADGKRIVITAAPPAMAASGLDERTFLSAVGPLHEEPTIAAECLFVDPVSDLAVLGPPDDQDLWDAAAAYEEFIATTEAIDIAHAQKRETGWLLSLKSRWEQCVVRHNGGGIWIFNASGEGINAGMSGSPIINSDGSAIGVVCLGNGEANATEGGPNPRLAAHLPGWLLKALMVT